MLQQNNIKDKPTTIKNPMANAICEWMHLTIKNMIRTYTEFSAWNLLHKIILLFPIPSYIAPNHSSWFGNAWHFFLLQISTYNMILCILQNYNYFRNFHTKNYLGFYDKNATISMSWWVVSYFNASWKWIYTHQNTKNNSLKCILTMELVIDSVRLSHIGYAIPFCKMELLHKPTKVHKRWKCKDSLMWPD